MQDIKTVIGYYASYKPGWLPHPSIWSHNFTWKTKEWPLDCCWTETPYTISLACCLSGPIPSKWGQFWMWFIMNTSVSLPSQRQYHYWLSCRVALQSSSLSKKWIISVLFHRRGRKRKTEANMENVKFWQIWEDNSRNRVVFFCDVNFSIFLREGIITTGLSNLVNILSQIFKKISGGGIGGCS